jgi:hypothetical protein
MPENPVLAMRLTFHEQAGPGNHQSLPTLRRRNVLKRRALPLLPPTRQLTPGYGEKSDIHQAEPIKKPFLALFLSEGFVPVKAKIWSQNLIARTEFSFLIRFLVVTG